MSSIYACSHCDAKFDTLQKVLGCYMSHEEVPEFNPAEIARPVATFDSANESGVVFTTRGEDGAVRFTAEGEGKAPPPMPEPKAAELLGRAARHMHDRASTYDQPDGERSMAKAVAAFNAITSRNLRESEGWLFMVLLKAVRAETRADPHQDSLEDLIAYGALYAEARGERR